MCVCVWEREREREREWVRERERERERSVSAVILCFESLSFLSPSLYIYIYIYKLVKLATVVEGDQKTPFSIATTPRCRGGCYSFPWIAPLYPWHVPYIAECLARRYQVAFLKSLVWLDPGLNSGHPDHWRTLYPLGQWDGIYIYIYIVSIVYLVQLTRSWE